MPFLIVIPFLYMKSVMIRSNYMNTVCFGSKADKWC